MLNHLTSALQPTPMSTEPPENERLVFLYLTMVLTCWLHSKNMHPVIVTYA